VRQVAGARKASKTVGQGSYHVPGLKRMRYAPSKKATGGSGYQCAYKWAAQNTGGRPSRANHRLRVKLHGTRRFGL